MSKGNGLAEYRKRRSAQNRASIMKAAMGLLLEFGPKRMNMTELAKRADVSSATIYKHFSSKHLLIEDCTMSLDKDDREKFLIGMAAASLDVLIDGEDLSKEFVRTVHGVKKSVLKNNKLSVAIK